MSNHSIQELPDLQTEYQLSNEQIKSFQKNGHTCLRGVASPEEISDYRNVINQSVQDYAKQLAPLSERNTIGKAFIQVSNLWEISEEVKKFVMAKRFAKIAAELLGVDGVRIYADQALYKEPGGGHTPWHQDQTYWPLDTNNTVTIWMPLVDISSEMGSMSFASETHKKGIMSKQKISDESHQTIGQYIDENNFKRVTHGQMNAGDATFHYGWTMHSAPDNPTDRTREVMTIIYFANGAKVSGSDQQYRKNDLKRWMPGLKEGDIVNSPLNPLVYHKEK